MHKRLALLAASAMLAVATPAAAHRQWMLPSATVLSGDNVWVTVDAAISNDIFYFDHQPMRTDNIKATAPDGTELKIENAATGRYRSTFDVQLKQKGTYRIDNSATMLMGSYTLGGEEKRLPRGTTPATLKTAIPAGATNVRTTEMVNRNEVFVTVGAPTTTVFKTSGTGIEMVPVTHPNDLVTGEAATFQFLLDGKPAAGLGVTVIPGGVRYRSASEEMTLKADAQGRVVITWPQPGMYWLNASTGGRPQGGPASPNAAAPAAPADAAPARRASYVTTLEVLAP
ncbi:DUF4198 domain-containing protein [Polymorphobacter sp.]|uniref:DUF4198 domain-containing protein n=1 Tax=Polymorphobacter sp. TaxID=1909290 RepID=UPI003F7136C4